jgi:F-type H+-transporting ATPase subunit delta
MRTARHAKRDATRLWRLCLVNGRADPSRVRLVVDRLVGAGGARNALTVSHVVRLLRLEEAKWSARVETAAPLEDAVRRNIEEGLATRYGSAMETTFVVDPAVVGGMRLTVGSDVYDGSIRARLAALEARF